MDRLVALCCPDLLDEGVRGEELRTFATLCQALGELCPWVEPIRLGIAVFPVRGPSRLLGGDAAVLAAAADAVSRIEPALALQIGVAPGLFAAQLAARQGVIVEQEGLLEFLSPWPISVLARPELASVLPRLGLRTLGQFAQLHHREVFGRFGADAAICLQVAQGKVGELSGLRDPSIGRRLRSLNPTNAPLPSQATFLGGVGLADERVTAAARRLQAQLGASSVMVGYGHGGRSPIDQARLVPFGSRPVVSDNTAPWPGQLPSPSPMTVFSDARAVELRGQDQRPITVDLAGLLSGAPATCALNGSMQRAVNNWAGPWPLVEQWWQAPRQRARLQLLLEPATAVLVVFEDGAWWLEAVYD